MKKWMRYPGTDDAPGIIWFRLKKYFTGPCEFEYSADETAQIFCDGGLIAAGPELGCPEYWYKQRVTLNVAPGEHILTVRVLGFGSKLTAHNQMSIRHGFFTTLEGEWECFRETACRFFAPWPNWGVYPRIEAEKNFNFAAVYGGGDGWSAPEYFTDDRILHDGELPVLLGKEVAVYHKDGDLIRFDDYINVFPMYRFAGKGSVEIRWGESGYLSSAYNRHTLKGEKGDRTGNFRVGDFDRYELPGGEVSIAEFQYRSGRYVEFRFNGDVHLVECSFRIAGYPYKFKVKPEEFAEKYRTVVKMAMRTLECCSYDTFMDCPYYERLMYLGDARMEALAAYASAGDDKLARKALRFFALSQRPDGGILSRYPARIDQVIASFVPEFILMLYDNFKFNQDREFLKELIPAARKAADYLLATRHEDDGLLYPPGWHFIDWQYPQRGVPFGFDDDGTTSVMNLLAALALQKLGKLENALGEYAAGLKYLTAAKQLSDVIVRAYYDEACQMVADDKKHIHYSEHAQVLCLLLREDMTQLLAALEQDCMKSQCGIYFSYYYLKVCRKYGKKELFDARLNAWCELEKLNLLTLPEEFAFPRSDCHAWGSHILYHLCCQ